MLRKKNIILLFIVLVFSVIGFNSCQVNKYKAPEIDSKNLFRDMNTTDSSSIANLSYKEFFKDSILVSLIDEGIKNNHDLNIAYERIKQAEINLSSAKAAFFPDVSLVGSVKNNLYSKYNNKEKILGYDKSNFTLGISSQWEADIWGKINSQKKAKYAEYLLTQAYKELTQTSLVANISTTYYSLLALDRQLEINKKTYKLLVENTQTMKAMMEAGLQNRAGVKQSEAFMYSTKINIPNIEIQIQKLENSLSLMLGRKPGHIDRTNIDNQIVLTEIKYGIPIGMLSKRPDVKQAELTFRQAFELNNVARASFYPSIKLEIGSMLGYTSSAISTFFRPENIFANIVGGLTQPIFAKKQLIANLNISKSKKKEALLNFEKTVLDASQEVSTLIFTYKTLQNKNTDRDSQVNALIVAVDDTQNLLKAGESNYIEVLNSEQNLLQAQISQVNDKLEQLQTLVNIYRALGGGIN